jgi:hypothetical protein
MFFHRSLAPDLEAVRLDHHRDPDGVVLAKISDISRFEAASGRFETIVDQQKSSKLTDAAS